MAELDQEGIPPGCQWAGCLNVATVRVVPTAGSCTDEGLPLCDEHFEYMKETKMLVLEDDEAPRPAYVPDDPSCIDPTD